MEKEYIQLPALKRDLDPDVVKALWAFIQLPEEYQARYQEQYGSRGTVLAGIGNDADQHDNENIIGCHNRNSLRTYDRDIFDVFRSTNSVCHHDQQRMGQYRK